MDRIALFGATGALGRSIAGALDAQERPYRAVARNAQTLLDEFGSRDHAERVVWDPDDTASVRNAAEGIDTIVYLVGVPYDRFDLHPLLMRKTLEGAIAAGVQHVLLAGTVYPYGITGSRPVREDQPRTPNTFKGRMRKAQEDVLLDAQSRGAISATIVRLPDFYGPGVEKSFLSDAFNAAVANRRANVVGPIDRLHQYIFIPDAGRALAAIADRPDLRGRTWHLGGSGTITARDFVTRIYRAAGNEPRMFVAGKNTLRVLGLVNPMMRELVEMHYLQTTPVILDDSALQTALGGIPKTGYDDGIAQTLQSLQKAAAV